MLRRVATALLLLTCASAFAGPKEDALAAYRKFFDLFTPDNHEQIIALFAPDAQFYGTLSGDLVTTPGGVRDYFVAALDAKRGPVKAVPLEVAALQITDSVVAISGKWHSERMQDGKMTPGGPLRNTVVMQKRGERWLIVQFHNSPVPKPPAAPVK